MTRKSKFYEFLPCDDGSDDKEMFENLNMDTMATESRWPKDNLNASLLIANYSVPHKMAITD